jgi:hypothetical protein
MGKTPKEGQGPPRTVEPMMMMMMIFIYFHTHTVLLHLDIIKVFLFTN